LFFLHILAVSFEVCVANRYKQDKVLRKLSNKKGGQDQYALQNAFSQAKVTSKKFHKSPNISSYS